jgi:hypothetical protein
LRRNIGRQKLRSRRIVVSIIIFSLASLALIAFSLQLPKLLLGISGGLVLGVLLGFVGLRLTKFETTDEGHFYTPDTRIGIVLSLLFVGRMIYRFWALRNVSATAYTPPPFQSALTFLVFGLIAGYYIVYYIGLLNHTHDKK